MNKYHINNEHVVGVCKARIRDCPFPSSDHFLNKEIATKESEQRLAQMHKVLPGAVKKRIEKEAADAGQKKPFTDMNATGVMYFADIYSDAKVSTSLLNRMQNYKTVETLQNHLDAVITNIPEEIKKDKVLVAISNNDLAGKHILLPQLLALTEAEVKVVAMQTRNKRVHAAALAYERKATTRNNALKNPMTTTEDIYAVSLMHPKNRYTQAMVASLKMAGYPTDHITHKRTDDSTSQILKMLKANSSFTYEQLLKRQAYGVLSQRYPNHPLIQDTSAAKRILELSKYANTFSPMTDRQEELIRTKRLRSKNYMSVPGQQPVKHTVNTPKLPTKYYVEEKEAANPAKADITTLEKFKNNAPMATYEESVKLQERWDKGIKDLPIDMQKEVVQKRFKNTQDGLRGIVDIFKTTDQEGQMVKSGLNNFVNHVNNMREQEVQKGYIAVDNPEFLTPSGMIKVEEHVGNFDYGEKMVFRVNGEKFEMSKAARSNRWNTFIHVSEDLVIEGEEKTPKKGFWAKLLGR